MKYIYAIDIQQNFTVENGIASVQLRDNSGQIIDTFSVLSGSYSITDASSYEVGTYHAYNLDSSDNLVSAETISVIDKPISNSEKILNAVNAVIENRATSAELKIQYKDKALEYYTIRELIMLKNHLINEINSESSDSLLSTIQVKFGEH